ncbi:MAG: hypothetical protein Q8O71_03990 [bacterium]|nr:hypothetical protein [bacterium]
MRILRVLGLGLLIILLKFLVPDIFSEIQQTIVLFLKTFQFALGKSQNFLGNSFTPTIPLR